MTTPCDSAIKTEAPLALSMEDTSLVGYGITLHEARNNLNTAIKFLYGKPMVPCENGGFHFNDPREKRWHVTYQRGKCGLIKAYLH
jgi:hypothetical protein